MSLSEEEDTAVTEAAPLQEFELKELLTGVSSENDVTKVERREEEEEEEELAGLSQGEGSSDKTLLLAENSHAEADPHHEESKHTSSLMGASFNFINSIIGAGIIGIPLALHQAGFITGILLLGLVAVITDYTVLLLVKNGIIAGKFTYQEMVTAAFGTIGYTLLTLAQFFFPFLGMVSYVVITGDTFSRILTELFVLADRDPIPVVVDSRVLKTVMVLVVMLPLSLLRNISRLEKAIGVMAFAFVCHHNTFLIYASLRKRSLTRFSRVTHFSVGSSFIFCVILGLAGFITFMGEIQGDLLNNYCITDHVANVARFLFACVIMLTYPIECFVAREVIEIALSRLPHKVISWVPVESIRRTLDWFLYTPRRKSLPRHIILTLLLVAGSLGIGLSTNDLGVVLTFNGCFTATPLAFILPTASYLKLSGSRWYSRDKVIAFVVMVFGIGVMLVGTGLAVVQAVASYSDQEEYDPVYCRDFSQPTTCCQLLVSTENFTTPAPLCDCTQFCRNQTTLELLMYSNSTCEGSA